jgi:hypothetical protein
MAQRHSVLGQADAGGIEETGFQTDPGRRWPARALAQHLGDITLATMYRQLSRWAEDGHISKYGPGIYTAATRESINSLA